MIALATTSIGWLIVAIIAIGYVGYYILNNKSARDELGSEIELAPNRKPYYDDDTLETKRLDRVLGMGVVLLAIIVVILPVYWILEPSRQAGAQEAKEEIFVEWGSGLFAPTADGGFNCAGCHGGMSGTGGVAATAITDPKTGEVRAVNWNAPALNTVLYRYSVSEVEFILVYGRPFSPMSPWGLEGGGPMNEQQIETLIEYLKSIQITPIGCTTEEFFSDTADPAVCDGGQLPAATEEEIQARAEQLVSNGTYDSIGEALFNNDLSAGAYSCARCHTSGWSYGSPGVTGQGAMGWNLTGGSANTRFANVEDMIAFLEAGSQYGRRYGNQAQGSGRMPGFGAVLTDEQITAVAEYVRSL